jgi:prolyl-tRNA synthetase
VELYSDADGMCLPVSIAPFEVVLTPVKATDPALKAAAGRLYEELKAAGVDVLYDDRDLSPGVKFKDADLIGVPFRVNIGKKLAEGKLELVNRRTRETREIDAATAAAEIRQAIEQARPQARH